MERILRVLPVEVRPHCVAFVQVRPDVITLAPVARRERQVERGARCRDMNPVRLSPEAVLPVTWDPFYGEGKVVAPKAMAPPPGKGIRQDAIQAG
jgi:hypothetical protein